MTFSRTILIATALMATTQFAEASNYTCAKGQMGLGSGEWMGHSYSTNTTDPEACKAHCEATAGCTGFDLYEHVQADSCRLTKNSTGFRKVGTSVRDICTKTDALGGNGQPMAQFFGSPPTCDTGYTAVSGDISGWGSINGKGGGQVVVSTGECASLCDSEATCASYEIGHHNGNLTCNLNTSEQANRGPYGDFAFCKKFGPDKTVTFGGSGGSYFAPQPVRSIAIRAGRMVDAIVINGVRYGGGGGSQTPTLTLGHYEYISEVTVRSQRLVDHIKITTNLGRSIEAGGSGGIASTFRGKITHIGGRRGGLLDQLVIKGQPTNMRRMVIGGSGGTYFAPQTIRKVAMMSQTQTNNAWERLFNRELNEAGYRPGMTVLKLNGTEYGNGGGSWGGEWGLKSGESIRHLVVRHTNDRVHGLMFVFSTGRKLCSGQGNWGDKTALSGRIDRIGGRAGMVVDQIIVEGDFSTSTENLEWCTGYGYDDDYWIKN